MFYYTIECLEKFVVKTEYTVKAENKEAAIKLIMQGAVPYDKVSIQEGDEEFLDVLSSEPHPVRWEKHRGHVVMWENPKEVK